MNRKVILFDFDGVIVDTFDFCFEIIRENFQSDLKVEDYRDRFMGNIYEHKETKSVVSRGESGEVDFFSLYAPKLREKEVILGIDNVIKKCAENSDLFIISSTTTAVIKEFLQKHDLIKYFVEIYGSDIHKSKIKKIQIILEKYRAKPEDCIFITDTVGDIIEARKCGIQSIGVSWGYHNSAVLSAAKPLAMVNTPEQLLDLLIK